MSGNGADRPTKTGSKAGDDLWRSELKERVDRLERLVKNLPPAQVGSSARSVREDRDNH